MLGLIVVEKMMRTFSTWILYHNLSSHFALLVTKGLTTAD